MASATFDTFTSLGALRAVLSRGPGTWPEAPLPQANEVCCGFADPPVKLWAFAAAPPPYVNVACCALEDALVKLCAPPKLGEPVPMGALVAETEAGLVEVGP